MLHLFIIHAMQCGIQKNDENNFGNSFEVLIGYYVGVTFRTHTHSQGKKAFRKFVLLTHSHRCHSIRNDLLIAAMLFVCQQRIFTPLWSFVRPIDTEMFLLTHYTLLNVRWVCLCAIESSISSISIDKINDGYAQRDESSRLSFVANLINGLLLNFPHFFSPRSHWITKKHFKQIRPYQDSWTSLALSIEVSVPLKCQNLRLCWRMAIRNSCIWFEWDVEATDWSANRQSIQMKSTRTKNEKRANGGERVSSAFVLRLLWHAPASVTICQMRTHTSLYSKPNITWKNIAACAFFSFFSCGIACLYLSRRLCVRRGWFVRCADHVWLLWSIESKGINM